MAEDKNREAFEKCLTGILVRVIDFLKFAEAKNAALLAFCSAWLLAFLTLMTRDPAPPTSVLATMKVAFGPFLISALLALWSFLPRLNASAFHRDPGADRNLLYFGHIADFDAGAYMLRVRERYMPDEGHLSTDRHLFDLSAQIAINSRIVRTKMRLFYTASTLLLIGISVLGLGITLVDMQALLTRLGVSA
jgi:hypothetical protein